MKNVIESSLMLTIVSALLIILFSYAMENDTIIAHIERQSKYAAILASSFDSAQDERDSSKTVSKSDYIPITKELRISWPLSQQATSYWILKALPACHVNYRQLLAFYTITTDETMKDLLYNKHFVHINHYSDPRAIAQSQTRIAALSHFHSDYSIPFMIVEVFHQNGKNKISNQKLIWDEHDYFCMNVFWLNNQFLLIDMQNAQNSKRIISLLKYNSQLELEYTKNYCLPEAIFKDGHLINNKGSKIRAYDQRIIPHFSDARKIVCINNDGSGSYIVDLVKKSYRLLTDKDKHIFYTESEFGRAIEHVKYHDICNCMPPDFTYEYPLAIKQEKYLSIAKMQEYLYKYKRQIIPYKPFKLCDMLNTQ